MPCPATLYYHVLPLASHSTSTGLALYQTRCQRPHSSNCSMLHPYDIPGIAPSSSLSTSIQALSCTNSHNPPPACPPSYLLPSRLSTFPSKYYPGSLSPDNVNLQCSSDNQQFHCQASTSLPTTFPIPPGFQVSNNPRLYHSGYHAFQFSIN